MVSDFKVAGARFNQRMSQRARKLCVPAALFIVAAAGGRCFGQYAFTPLGSATGAGGTSSAMGISQNGMYITGGTTTSGGASQAYLLDTSTAASGTLTALGAFNSPNGTSVGLSVNNAGHIAGNTSSYTAGVNQGFFYDGSFTNTTFGQGLGNGNASEANGINNSDVIVGGVAGFGTGATQQHVYYFAAGTAQIVGSSAVGNSYNAIAYGISNSLGTNSAAATSAANFDFVGETDVSTSNGVATAHQAFENSPNNSVTVLRNPSANFYSTSSIAYAINDSGAIAGQGAVSTSNTTQHALYNPTPAQGAASTIDLGSLGGVNMTSAALAVNSSGVVVGQTQIADGSQHAFIYQNSTMFDLNSLVTATGWTLTSANGIDNNGDIVGNATNNTSGVMEGFELTVPEPASASICLLALLGLAPRRRRSN